MCLSCACLGAGIRWPRRCRAQGKPRPSLPWSSLALGAERGTYRTKTQGQGRQLGLGLQRILRASAVGLPRQESLTEQPVSGGRGGLLGPGAGGKARRAKQQRGIGHQTRGLQCERVVVVDCGRGTY